MIGPLSQRAVGKLKRLDPWRLAFQAYRFVVETFWTTPLSSP
jgi:hypothetical protein